MGNRSRRENFDADEEEGKEKEETLSEALPRTGPEGFSGLRQGGDLFASEW
jgi:hypothetical protein